MKTHRIILAVLFLLCSSKLHPQDVSIHLSLRWEDAPCIFNSDLIVPSPRLVVAYKNESDTDIYFLKMSREKYGLPVFPWCLPGYMPYEQYLAYKEGDYSAPKSKISHNKYNGEKFTVDLTFSKWPNNYWWVLPKFLKENLKDDDCFEHPEIDCTLADITDFIMKKFHGGLNDSLYQRYFNLSDITEDALAIGCEKNFCFLRAGESKEDVYDITALWMAEGIFEFEITNERFPDEVVVGENLHDPSGVIYPTAKLPEKVGGYQLYAGKFTYNRLTVEF